MDEYGDLTLLLLRHGKSDWSADYGPDIDRPLSRRGHKAAQLVGRFLSAADAQPEVAISSPARRADTTLRLAYEAGAWTCPTITNPELYEGGPEATLECLRTSVTYPTRRVLVVGHEPTWSDLVALLTGATIRFPTAAIARIDLHIGSWDALGPRTGQLSWLIPPRLLKTARRT